MREIKVHTVNTEEYHKGYDLLGNTRPTLFVMGPSMASDTPTMGEKIFRERRESGPTN